ncbi:MAG: Endo-1,4-beta-xylanase A precursor [Smithella sp. PtaU1.Bin162]|nr:MAG: Endo-1,4-beta-xylanase A precursor [Smithella sp. PtaU1.Bin162]
MIQIKKIFLLVMCGITMNGLAAADAGLKGPVPPFMASDTAPKQPASMTAIVPQITDNEITLGSKSLICQPSGNLKLLQSGKQLAEMYLCPYISGSYGNCTDNKTELLKDKKTIKCIAKIPVDHNTYGKYIQQLTLLPDNRIQFELSFELPPGTDKQLFNQHSFFRILVPIGICEGQKCVINGNQDYRFSNEMAPIADRSKLLSASFATTVDFIPDNKPAGFKIAILDETQTTVVTLYENRYKSNYTYQNVEIRILPSQADGRMTSFILDLGDLNPAPADRGDSYCGIDFWGSDRMHVPEYNLSRNLLQNPSFEGGMHYYAIANHGNYYPPQEDYAVDPATAKFGRRSLKITPQDLSGPYPAGLGTFVIPVTTGKEYTFSFYAKADRPGLRLVVESITAKWPVFPLLGKTCVPTPEWTRYSYSFVAPNSCVSLSFRGYYTDAQNRDGHLWVDGLQLEAGKLTDFTEKPLLAELVTNKPGNFFQPDDPIVSKLIIHGKPGTQGSMDLQLKDFFGELLWKAKYDYTIDVKGEGELSLPLDNALKSYSGIFVLEAAYRSADGFADKDYFRLSKMKFLRNEHANKNITADDCVGNRLWWSRWKEIGLGAVSYYCLHEALSYVEHREHLNKDKFEFTGLMVMDDAFDGSIIINNGFYYDQTKNKVLISGLKAMDKITPETEKAVEEAAYEKAKSLPWIQCWNFEGECMPRFTKLLPEKNVSDFVKLLMATYRGVKRFNPKLQVMLSQGPCNMMPQGGIREVDMYLKAINGRIKFDGIGIHPYRAKPEDPDLDDDTQVLFKMLDRHGYNSCPVYWYEGILHTPYIIPSWDLDSHKGCSSVHFRAGTVSYDMGWGEKICAAYYARSWLVAFKYQDRIKTYAGWASSINSLMLDYDMVPFALQKIPNTLGNILGNARFKKDVRFAPYTRAYVFEDKDGTPVAAVWSYIDKVDRGEKPCPVAEISFKAENLTFADLMGTEKTAPRNQAGNYLVPISPFPLFIRAPQGQLNELLAALSDARLLNIKSNPINLAAQLVDTKQVIIWLTNQLTRRIAGILEIGGRTEKLDLSEKETKKIPLMLNRQVTVEKIRKFNIPLSFEYPNGDKSSVELSFEAFAATKVKPDTIKIDGDLEDWKNIPQIPIVNKVIAKKSKEDQEPCGYAGDFSASFSIAWDDEKLYLAVRVIDDKLYLSPGKTWDQDSLQVYFDTQCNARLKATKGFDTDDYNYDFYFDRQKNKLIAFRRYTPEEQLTGGVYCLKNNCVESNVETAFQTTSNGYIYEVAFPKRYLEPIRFEKNTTVGFGIYLNDADEAKGFYPPKQGLSLTPEGTACFMHPDLYPAMILTE